MPLNQSQRDEIEKSISHFFYDLATTQDGLTTEITALRQALDKGLLPPLPKPSKPNEEKEREEKHVSPEAPFAHFTTVIQELESFLKGLEKRNQSSRITLNETIEYIIFYSICRLQFHLQFLSTNQEPEDDFNINEWLLPVITPAQNPEALHGTNAALAAAESPEERLAKTPWQLQTWLSKTNAKAAMQQLGWNIETTFELLQNRENKPFETYKPLVDHGSYNFNWELPPLPQRMYTAKIIERWVQPTDKAGKVIRVTAYVDLQITAHLSQHKKFETTLPAFKPYPYIHYDNRDTAIEAEQKVLAAEETIKNAAKIMAEKEAIKLIMGHLENLDQIHSNSEAQLREDSVSTASTVSYEFDPRFCS